MHKYKIVRSDGSHFTQCGDFFDTKDAAKEALGKWLESFPNFRNVGYRVKASLYNKEG